MDKYICRVCATIYNPDEGDLESGIPPKTAFENLPDTWNCPICGSTKEHFEILSQEEYEKIKGIINNNSI